MFRKTYTPFIALLIMILFNSCKDNITAFEFTHDYAAINVAVTPSSAIGEMTFTTEEIETDIQEIASDNGINTDNIKSVTVSEVIVTLIDNAPAPYTFDLLDRIESKIGKTTDGTLIKFAGKDPVPDGGSTEFKMDVNNIELVDYFKNTRLKFQLSGFTNDSIEHAFTLKVEMKITVEGELID